MCCTTALAARRPGAKLAGMKLRALFAKSLFLAASLSIAGPLLAQGTPASNSSDATKKPAATVKHTIPGLALARDKGGFLGLEIDNNNNFKLSFYDKDKAPVVADVTSATISWFFHDNGKEKFIYALSPGADGKSLTSPRAVVPPLPRRAVLFLFSDATSGNPAEAYRNQDLTSLGATP
jgi:hypothetical protein